MAENEWYDAYTRIEAVVEPDLSPAAFRRTLTRAARLGITGVVDLERGQTAADWEPRDSPIRVRVATYADGLDAAIAAGLRSGDLLPGSPDTITMGPLKIISDGSLNTRTAWCCEDYADGSGAGAPNQTTAELTALLERAKANGLEVATHAIGDLALREAITAYDESGAAGSIEHVQLVRRADLATMARLGLRASVQPAHLLDDRDVTEACWPDRAGRCFAFRWMLDAGVRMAFGSDAPVSPLDPWLAIAAAVHRSADEREAWHPEQAVTPREALAASVDGRRSVRAGMPADLVLLDADPLDPDGGPAEQAARLRQMPVAVTFVGQRAGLRLPRLSSAANGHLDRARPTGQVPGRPPDGHVQAPGADRAGRRLAGSRCRRCGPWRSRAAGRHATGAPRARAGPAGPGPPGRAGVPAAGARRRRGR